MSAAVTQNMLQGYVDGQLSVEDIAAVEAYLGQHPDAAADVAVWQRQRDAISTLFAPVAAEPVPARLRPARIAAERQRHFSGSVRRAVAAVLLLAIGLGAGWYSHRVFEHYPSVPDQLIASAVNAHNVFVVEKRHAVEVGASDQDHLVSWLSNRLNTPVGTPDLTAAGFNLVGGRLLPGDPSTGRAAQLMYEDSKGERVTVYLTAALPDRTKAFQFAALDKTDAFYWADAFMTCTVVGALPEDQMKTVSQAIYKQLTALDDAATRPTYHG